mmetsp:Transcript_17415/g.36935  ORF Transcript_17415/g.36935 Transcript_17415/m.36935 type:complete len:659 (+) Transcript_17415:254-2230(+)
MKDESNIGAPPSADHNSTHDQPFTPEGATVALHSNEAQFTMARNIYRRKPHLAICELIAGAIDRIQTDSAASKTAPVRLIFSEGFRGRGFLVGNSGIRGLQDPINAMNHGFSDVGHDARCEGRNGCALKDAKMAVADSFITISSLGDGKITLILHTKHLHDHAQTCYYMITYKDRQILHEANAPVSSDKSDDKQVGYTSKAQLDGFLRHLKLANVSELRPLLKWASKLLAKGGLLHYFYESCDFVKVSTSEGGSIFFDDTRAEDENKMEWTRDLKKVVQAKLIGAPDNIEISWFGTSIDIRDFAWDRRPRFLDPPGITEASADQLQRLQGSLPQGVEVTKMMTGFHEDIVAQCQKYQQDVKSKKISWRPVMSSVPTGVIIINETKSRMTALHSFPAKSDRLYKNAVAGRCNLSIVYLKDPEQKLEKGADSGSYVNDEMNDFYEKVCGIAAASAKDFVKCEAGPNCHAHADSMFSAHSARIACSRCGARCHAECLLDGDHCDSCDVAAVEEHVPQQRPRNTPRPAPIVRPPPPAPAPRPRREQASPQTQLTAQSPNPTRRDHSQRANRVAQQTRPRMRPSPPDEEPSPPTQPAPRAMPNNRKRKISEDVATTAKVLRRIIDGEEGLAEELQAEWEKMNDVPPLAMLGEWFPERARRTPK